MQAPRSGPRVLLRSEQTRRPGLGDRERGTPGFTGPPLHHHDFDETFYVVEGELTFQLHDELLGVKSGQLAFAPRGAPHTFTNLGPGPARYLIVCTPGRIRALLRAHGRRATRRRPARLAPQSIPEVTTVGRSIDPGRRREVQPINTGEQ